VGEVESLFDELITYLRRVPAIAHSIGSGKFDDSGWWVKFSLDISHPLAWNVVQELGHVLNYLSVEERLPTVFMPVSPPPYLNGGPSDFLSWVIESHASTFSPSTAAMWLEGRLPQPVEDLMEWEAS
jgi:hypothetical protein